MNEKFFSLPEEKQQKIINAGYRVFSRNSYKKSPMSEIAAEAGISKSLLFHYFHNKKELYLFLWENCAEMTIRYLQKYECYEQRNLFEMIYRGMKAKIRIMHRHPDMGRFAVKVFYERDPEVGAAIQESYKRYKDLKANITLLNLDPKQFREGIDISLMYQDMYLASLGYLWEFMQDEEMDAEKVEEDFSKMIEFWKKIYLREQEGEEGEVG